MDPIIELLEKFMNAPEKRCIYNEFALQFELGFFFTAHGFKVYFERNIKTFEGLDSLGSNEWIKHEMDLVLEKDGFRYAIELKFPRNGEYPEQMFQFLKDIRFMEQVHDWAHFKGTYTLTVVLDPLFYRYPIGKVNKAEDGAQIYTFFRIDGGDKNSTSMGLIPANIPIQKPTGEKDKFITFRKPHSIIWQVGKVKWDYLDENEKDAQIHYYIVSC